MKKIVLIIVCFTFAIAGGTQIGGVTYFDYTSGEGVSAFNFNRQYISFKGDASDDVSYKVVFDVIANEDIPLLAFLKIAQVNYKCSFGTTNMGLIAMNTYGVQEKNWGYRFIEKTAIDKNGFSSTADLGVGHSMALADQLNLSLQFVNGEGFQSAQDDEHHKLAFNATYGNGNLSKSDGYNAGLIYTTESTENDPNTMMSVFGGFASNGLRFGGEYDISTVGGVERNLISVSASYGVTEKLAAFVRYDMFDRDTSIDLEAEDDLIAGVVLHCGSGLSVSPNLRMTTYENDSESVMTYKMNVQFKF